MVVKKKPKVYQKPPDKYHFEKQAQDLSLQNVHGFSIIEPDYSENSDKLEEKVPLHAISWGWNASKRAGNATEVEIREPGMVQRSIKQNYMTSGAGTHHSVLLSDDGSAYTFGEGRSGQLGIGNPFSDHLGGYIQSFPRETNPTGITKFGRGIKRDIKMVEIACGCNFSIGREINVTEALRHCLGYMHLLVIIIIWATTTDILLLLIVQTKRTTSEYCKTFKNVSRKPHNTKGLKNILFVFTNRLSKYAKMFSITLSDVVYCPPRTVSRRARSRRAALFMGQRSPRTAWCWTVCVYGVLSKCYSPHGRPQGCPGSSGSSSCTCDRLKRCSLLMGRR
jgi:hypothetical protein